MVGNGKARTVLVSCPVKAVVHLLQSRKVAARVVPAVQGIGHRLGETHQHRCHNEDVIRNHFPT